MVVAIVFAASISLVVALSLRAIWKSLDPAKIGQYRACKGGWWEAELNNCSAGLLLLPQQPINTYTNVCYVAGGSFLAFELNTLPSYVFALACLYLCAGSSLYHATSTRWAGSLDVSGMYAVFSSLMVYAGSTLTSVSDPVTALVMFVVAAYTGYVLRYRFRGDTNLKIGIFLFFIYGFLIWKLIRDDVPDVTTYLIVSFALFLLAFVIWMLDKKRLFPVSRWGHGIWHILTAIAISMLFFAIQLSR
jgi:predicted membrane channel-forming protein YqfA (hemolysin III family)